MRPTGAPWLLAGVVAWLAARRWLDVVEVRGRSMAPALLPGDRLVVLRAPARRGDVVIAPDPREPARELIKRVHATGPAGVVLRGDNPGGSTDGRTFGPVAPRDVAWRAVLRYWPPGRVGRVPSPPASLEPVDEGGEPACAFPDALIAGDEAPASVSPAARSRPAAIPPPSR